MMPPPDAPLAEVGAAIDRMAGKGRAAALLPLLEEGHALYGGRSRAETLRIRGYLVAAFARTGLPDAALAFVVEELESGRHPYGLAAAAYALRGRRAPGLSRLLVTALARTGHDDDQFCFDAIGPAIPAGAATTTARSALLAALRRERTVAPEALAEMRAMSAGASGSDPEFAPTLAHLERLPQQDCCLPAAGSNRRGWRRFRVPEAGAVRLEDHEGKPVDYRDFFCGKPTLLAFFYTRCDNPDKCSLTISRLAVLRRSLREQGLEGKVRIAAISYDAGFDQPHRLRNYCQDRQLALDEDCRAFRIEKGAALLRRELGLGVNYIGSIVNRHRVELYLLGADGRPAAAFTRVRWKEEAVVAQLRRLLQGRSRVGGWVRRASSALLYLALAFFPKCPFCLAAYLSLFGITGLNYIALTPWAKWSLLALLGVQAWVLWRRAMRSGAFWAIGLWLPGAVLLLLNLAAPAPALRYLALTLLSASALASAFPRATLPRLAAASLRQS